MANAAYAQCSFLGGIWSKHVQGRFDTPDYRTALNECLNSFPIEQAAWTRRPGTRNVGTTRGGAIGRLIPFEFKQSAPYNMEFTSGFLRFWDGPNPVMTNDGVFISSISTANPAVVTIGSSRTFATGDHARLVNLGITCAILQNRELTLTRLTGTTYELHDALTGDGIDGSLLDTPNPSTMLWRIQEIATLFTDSVWPALRSVQTEKKAILLSSVAPQVLTQTTDPVFSESIELTTYAQFSLDQAIFQDGPYLDPVSDDDRVTRTAGTLANLSPQFWNSAFSYSLHDVVYRGSNGENYISLADANLNNDPATDGGVHWSQINPGDSSTMHLTLNFTAWSSTQAYAKGDFVLSSSTGWVSLADGNQNKQPSTNPTYWAAANFYDQINDGAGFVATDVGRSVRFFIEPTLWDRDKNYSAGDIIVYSDVAYQALASTTGNQPDANPTKWSINPTARQWTWGTITSLISAGEVIVQVKGVPLLYNLPIRTWRLGLYSDTTGYPTCGTYHEGRLWLSGAVPNRVDSTTVNGVRANAANINCAPTDYLGAVGDSNAISYTFNAPDVNDILWMSTDAAGIVCGTQAGEWLIQASANNNVLTPTSIQAHRVTHNGCENVEPRRTGSALVLVQRFGRQLLEYFADVFSGKFSAQNIAFRAKQLFLSGIEEIAYQNELIPIIWARCGDGSFSGITYKRESIVSSQPPNFWGAHRHILGSGRLVESICVGPSLGGNLDTLAMVTSDGSVRHIELLTDLYNEGADPTTAWFVDGGIKPSSYQISGSNLIINGLWLHNGKTLAVWAGGLDCGDYVVSNGSVSVPFGDGAGGGTGGGFFTASFVSSFGGAMPIAAGFSYASKGQLLRPASPQDSGARNGPALGKMRRNHSVAMLLEGVITGSMKWGTDFSGTMRTVTLKTKGLTDLTVQQPFSGVVWDQIEDEDSYDGMICWQITRPYPATIVAIEGYCQTRDK